MKGKALALFAAEASLLCGCAMLRWSGNADAERDRNWVWSTGELAVSSGAAAGSRPAPPESLPDTLYYADLGPEFIDVSAYPDPQKHGYELFKDACARCHTLARAVSSPVQSRLYWRFHLDRMNLHSRFRHQPPLSEDEKRIILDFLEYDAQVRKVQDRKRFTEQTEELQRRFEPVLERILSRMRSDLIP